MWINHFAPRSSAAKWLGFNQIFTCVGITGGYVVGSFATDWQGTWVEEYFDWHTAFASQGYVMIIIGFLFCFFDNKNIDILRTGSDRGDEEV